MLRTWRRWSGWGRSTSRRWGRSRGCRWKRHPPLLVPSSPLNLSNLFFSVFFISASSFSCSGRLRIAQCCPLLTTFLNLIQRNECILVSLRKKKERRTEKVGQQPHVEQSLVFHTHKAHLECGLGWCGGRLWLLFVGESMKPAAPELNKESADFSSHLSPSSDVSSSGGSTVSSYWAPRSSSSSSSSSAEGLRDELPVHVPACSVLYFQ